MASQTMSTLRMCRFQFFNFFDHEALTLACKKRMRIDLTKFSDYGLLFWGFKV